MSVVDGGIGAGKTTACAQLEAALGVRVVGEPVENNPVLPLFYGDMPKYALLMQLWILRQRYIAYCDAVRSPGARIVCDRFVGSDWAFFISNVWLGNIAEEAVGRYSALYTHLMADVPMVRDVFFLDAPPAICLERVRMRSRGAESGISAAYLEMLGRGYESARARLEAQGVRWHVLDWAGAGDHAALEAAVAATEPFSDAELARMPSLAEQRRRVARLDAWFAEEIARVGAHELAGACR